MTIGELKDKKILIVGFGREGQDSFLFLRKKFPDKNIGIADQKEFENFPQEVQKLLNHDLKVILYFGPSYLAQAKAYDVIIKAPGVPLEALRNHTHKRQTITSQTNIFFTNCPGTIIGITGTKGKSTTASLIHAALKALTSPCFLTYTLNTWTITKPIKCMWRPRRTSLDFKSRMTILFSTLPI